MAPTPLVLPTTTMPGQRPQESGGRLINAFPESLGETGPSKFKLLRCPGMLEFGSTVQTGFRGGKQVGSLAYTAWSGKVVTHASNGGTPTVLTGSLLGTDGVFMARNNASTPDLVIVSPANGAFVATTAAVSAYPDSDVGAPVDVCFLKGYFIYPYGNGEMQASGLNNTAIDTLDRATAESKPDTLYRTIPRGDTLIALGSQSIEFWGINGEPTGFPFSPITTHDRGLVGRYALAGHEEGFGYGIFFVADDNTVRQLDGYASTKVSTPDLDRLIEAVSDKSTIQCSVYVSQGHPFLTVQCAAWTWVFDVILQRWHERASYNRTRWKGSFPFKAFDRWICGNIANSNLFEISSTHRYEDGEPLIAKVRTGPMGNFPYGIRVNRLDLLLTGGVGSAPGSDPIETDPTIDIYISHDLGLSFSNAYQRKVGKQGESPNVTVFNMGLCRSKGVVFEFHFSDPTHFGLMGGTFDGLPLVN